ncbi:MAG TPA: bacterioferritin [Kofleriaceae bacterium]|jgi:bacterioferritin
MKGHAKVLEILNDLLTNELTSVNQYFIHARMCENWGYKHLGQKVREESIDEMKHADRLIQRILYLDGVPNLQKLNKVNVGQTVQEQLTLDLDLEKGAIKFLNDGIETVRSLGDHGSFELMVDILTSEEEHADWLEAQLALIDQVGLQNYLAQQIRG